MSDETTGPSPEEMGLTPNDLKTENEQSGNPKETPDKPDSEKKETNPEKGVEIPMYNTDDQIKLKEGDDYLSVVGTEKLRAEEEIDDKRPEYPDELPGGRVEYIREYGGEGLEWAAKNTDRDVGLRFMGHGLEKDSVVRSLDKLITKGLEGGRTFYSTNFTYTPKMTAFDRDPMPFTGGGLIVVGDYDKRFPYEGDPQIKYILVDEQYMRVVDIMQERYAEYGIKVVPWHDVPKVLTEDYNSHNLGKEIQPLASFDSESPPTYNYGPEKPPDSEKSKPNRRVQATDLSPNDDRVW